MNDQLHSFTLFKQRSGSQYRAEDMKKFFFYRNPRNHDLSSSRSFFMASIFLSRITGVKGALRDLGGLWPSYVQFKDWIILYKKQNFRFLGPSELLNIPFTICEWCDLWETLPYRVDDHLIEVMFFFFSRRFTVFTLHSFSSAVLRVPLGQIYILILDISKNFAEMAWNSPKRVNFTSFECNGRKAPITNHVWSGSRENPSPSFVKSDTTNLGNIFHRCCYRNKFA